MDFLPDDILQHIKECFDDLDDFKDLVNLKFTCKNFNQLISSFSLRKLMFRGNFPNYKPIKMCINRDCFNDTWDIYDDVYNAGYRRYLHHHQPALNNSDVTINGKQYNIHTPYCCECFTTFVLIGDKNNVTHNLMMDRVNIEY